MSTSDKKINNINTGLFSEAEVYEHMGTIAAHVAKWNETLHMRLGNKGQYIEEATEICNFLNHLKGQIIAGLNSIEVKE